MIEASIFGIGVLLFFYGPLITWLSSLAPYGFGQLIENTDKMVSNCQSIQKGLKNINVSILSNTVSKNQNTDSTHSFKNL